MLASAALLGMLAAGPAPDPAPEPDDGPYTPGIYGEAAAGGGLARRRVVTPAPTETGELNFQRAAASVDTWIRLGGVPARAPSLELFGQMRLRTTIGARVAGGTQTGSHRRPRARGQHTQATFGLVLWPRAIGHKFGFGGEFGYAIDPLLVESKVDLPTYVLHGPIVVGRLEAMMPTGAVRFAVRPFVGAAVTEQNLRAGGYHKVSPQWGVSAMFALRIFGTLHAFVNFTERHAPLRYGQAGVFDDFERSGALGLMVRASMNPRDNNRGEP